MRGWISKRLNLPKDQTWFFELIHQKALVRDIILYSHHVRDLIIQHGNTMSGSSQQFSGKKGDCQLGDSVSLCFSCHLTQPWLFSTDLEQGEITNSWYPQNLKCTQTDKENKFEWYIFAQTAPIPQWCALDQIRHCVTILCNTYYLNIYYLKCEYVPRWEQTM